MFKWLVAGLLVLLMTGSCAAGEIHIIFWTIENCGPCHKAHNELESDDTYNSWNPETVDPDKLKTPDEKEFFKYMKVKSFPTFIIYKELTINGATYIVEMGRLEGYTTKESFLNNVKRIAAGSNAGGGGSPRTFIKRRK